MNLNLNSDDLLLTANLKKLSSDNEQDRITSTKNIKVLVETAARELSLERFENFERDLFKYIFSLILSESSSLNTKSGGVIALKHLIDCTSAAAESKLITFANTLSEALKSNTDFFILEQIADAFGHMARYSLVLHLDCIERELNNAFDWLRSSTAIHQRFASCAILKVLAENAPTLLFARIKDFFDLIWDPLWDSKDRIRFAASKALSSCLSALVHRTYHLEWYCWIYEQIFEGFRRNMTETIHGSLLILSELLKHTGDFMIPRFKEICKAIMTFKDHKSKIVKSAIINLLPLLGTYCPDAFAKFHLNESVDFLIKCTKSLELRPEALIATGQLCRPLGIHLVTRVDELLGILRDILTQHNNSQQLANQVSGSNSGLVRTSSMSNLSVGTSLVASEALHCISDMVSGLGSPFHSKVLSLLDPMIQTGLTSELIETLQTLASYIPTQKYSIQKRLLEEATKILGGDSTIKIIEPNYLYSWGKIGSRTNHISLLKSCGIIQLTPKNPQDDSYLRYRLSTTPSPSSNMLRPQPKGVTGSSNPSMQLASVTGHTSADAQGYGRAPKSSTNSGGLSLRATTSSMKAAIIRTMSPTPPQPSNANDGTGKDSSKDIVSANLRKKGITGNPFSYLLSNFRAKATGSQSIGSTAPSSALLFPKVSNQPPQLIILALKTLGSLSIPSVSLPQLIQGSIVPYLTSDYQDIRKEASITCVHMITSSLSSIVKSSGNSNGSRLLSYRSTSTSIVIEDIITKLIDMTVADASTNVRLALLRAIPEVFDTFLSRQHNIYTLSLLLADESFDIKLEALTILGRLSTYNPAAVLPSLRLLLIRLISELSQSSDIRIKEEAASLICTYMRAMALQPLIKAYLGTLIRVLPLETSSGSPSSSLNQRRGNTQGGSSGIIPSSSVSAKQQSYLHQPENFRLITASLEAVGEICLVMREDTIQYIDHLLNVVIINIRDSSSRRKQEVALKTLGQLVSATGQVVRPYLKYPQLLPYILDLLFLNSLKTVWTLRREALRTLGLLGALEPRKYSLIVSHLEGIEKSRNECGDSEMTTDKESKQVGVNREDSAGAGNAAVVGILPRSKTKDSGFDNVYGGTVEASSSVNAVYQQTSTLTVTTPNNSLHTTSNELIQSEVLLDEDNADSPSYLFMYEQSAYRSLAEPTSSEAPRLLPSSDDYYPQTTIIALMKIIKENSLNVHHSSAAQTIVMVLRSLGSKCSTYLDTILPYMLKMVRRSGSGLQESLLQQISVIISIAGGHINSYLPLIFEIMRDYWNEHLEQVLTMVKEISIAASELFATFMPDLLPLLLATLSVPTSLMFAFSSSSYSSKSLLPSLSNNQNTSSSGLINVSSIVSTSSGSSETGFIMNNSGNPNYLQLGGLSLSGSGNIANGNNANNNSSAVVNNNPNGGNTGNSSISGNQFINQTLKNLEQTLYCCIVIRMLLRPYIHLVIPALCHTIHQLTEITYTTYTNSSSTSNSTHGWLILAIRTLRLVATSGRGDIIEQTNTFVTRVVHTLTDTLFSTIGIMNSNSTTSGSSTSQSMIGQPASPRKMSPGIGGSYNDINLLSIFIECLDTLVLIGKQLGPRFITFDTLILQAINAFNPNSSIVQQDSGSTQQPIQDYIDSYLQLSADLHQGNLSEFGYGDITDYFPPSIQQEYYDYLLTQSRDSSYVNNPGNIPGLGSGQGHNGFGQTIASPARHPLQSFLSFYGASGAGMSGMAGSGMGLSGNGGSSSGLTSMNTNILKHPMNQAQLARAWDVTQRSTASDWNEWLRRLKVDLIRESPSPVIRSCAALAQAYLPLANDLFHASFVSCWQELSEGYQESLVRALQAVFRSNTIPPEILQTLLNLAEFMEHDVEALPISLSILAELAQKSRAYAKALHYRELEFQSNPVGCFEALININKKLDQYDAAVGIVDVVKALRKKHPELEDSLVVQDSWLAKLGYWEEALVLYDRRLDKNPDDSVAISGKLKCLEALGRWEETISICRDRLDFLKSESEKNNSNIHTKAAVIAARAAWSLSEWTIMDDFVSELSSDNVDGSFMKAVLATHRDDFLTSEKLIDQTRRQLDTSISALLSESYGRAYISLSMLQQCAELEEIMEYKKLLRLPGISAVSSPYSDETRDKLIDNRQSKQRYSQASLTDLLRLENHMNTSQDPSVSMQGLASSADLHSSSNPANSIFGLQQHITKFKTQLANKWRKRLKGCYSSGKAAIPFWKYLLNGRRLILHEREDLDIWLEFASLCRNTDNTKLSERILDMSMNIIKSSTASAGNASKIGLGTRQLSGASYGTSSNKEISAQEYALMDSKIKFAILKQEWVTGNRYEALRGLEILIRNTVSPSIGNISTNSGSLGFGNVIGSLNNPSADATAVQVNCLLKLGAWKLAMIEPGMPVDANTRSEVIDLYQHATSIDPMNYLAWHRWGLSNYRAIEEARGKTGRFMSQRTHRLPSDLSFLQKPTSNPTSAHVSPNLSRQRLDLDSISSGDLQGLHGLNDKSGGFGVKSSSQPSQTNKVSIEVLLPLVINALKGLFRAISLATRRWSSSVTQDMLTVLTLWFKYGRIKEVKNVIEIGLSQVHADNWLGVLPQLIARIDHPDTLPRDLLHNLIIQLGQRHAQALVFPLSVAIKSPRVERIQAANSLMYSLRQHSLKVIDHALLVSEELVRVAIVWEEMWHESLEEASRQYFGDGNVQGMIETLLPLYQKLEEGAQTSFESNFVQMFGRQLMLAWSHVKKYQAVWASTSGGKPLPTSGQVHLQRRKDSGTKTIEEEYLHSAWELYYQAFQDINKKLPSITQLELQYCSPKLLQARDLDLGVPGTYISKNGQAVRIKSFHPIIAIIKSKQRPRKLKVLGEDGRSFLFLLKGHEDLRQDERAMQLFGLVNALLVHDRRTNSESHNLTIERYAVIPLSPTAGLISWVPNCDTLHDLIREYRDTRRIILNVEHKLMQQCAPSTTGGYDILTLPQKLEIFEYALQNTTGEDLAKILWLKSESSEAWLQRRLNYTRSLAVMSMVGYILGLGDRHPSNLMLNRGTGKVLHIDFGDCFEVACHRDKFPEKVPFRLTRMLVNAMEVSGIEGNFRLTCEKVMSVLRENRDSLIATLEAFVYDPLISWRLLNPTDKQKLVPVTATPAPTASKAANKQSNSSTRNAQDSSGRRDSSRQTDPDSAKRSSNADRIVDDNKALRNLETIFQEVETTSNNMNSRDEASLSNVQRPRRGTTSVEDVVATTPPTALLSSAIAKSLSPQHKTNNLSQNNELLVDREIDNINNVLDQDPVLNPSKHKVDEDSTETDVITELQQVSGSKLPKDPHLAMSYLAKSLHEDTHIATSVARPSIRQISLAQAAAVAGSSVRRYGTSSTIASYRNVVNISSVSQQESSHAIEFRVSTRHKPVDMLHPTINEEGEKLSERVEAEVKNPSQKSKRLSFDETLVDRAEDRTRSVIATDDVHKTIKVNENIINDYETGHTDPHYAIAMDGQALEISISEVGTGGIGTSGNTSTTNDEQDDLSEKAVLVIRRVMDKLTGLDFSDNDGIAGSGHTSLDVHSQVNRLIMEATSNENLCRSFIGWCPFW